MSGRRCKALRAEWTRQYGAAPRKSQRDVDRYGEPVAWSEWRWLKRGRIW